MSRRWWLSVVLAFTFSVPARADVFDLSLPLEPQRPRAYFGPQLLTFFLPGFDQFYEMQTAPAFLYAGTAVAGLGVISAAAPYANANASLGTRNDADRALMLGAQLYQSAGAFSAYASFRSAVRTQQPAGRFAFLVKEDDVGDVLLAPFHLSELARPTTLVPLALLTALVALDSRIKLRGNVFGFKDAFYASTFSYQAGTSEEALFRGWLMPVGQEIMGNAFLGNSAQALLFGAAHISQENRVPWIQTLLGFYLGYLTQRNDGSIRQSAFVHAWWDLIAFTASYLEDASAARIEIPLHFAF